MRLLPDSDVRYTLICLLFAAAGGASSLSGASLATGVAGTSWILWTAAALGAALSPAAPAWGPARTAMVPRDPPQKYT